MNQKNVWCSRAWALVPAMIFAVGASAMNAITETSSVGNDTRVQWQVQQDSVAQRDSTARKKPSGRVFERPEVMPEYPGGPSALMEYVKSHMKYPASAAKAKKQGRAVVRFVVETDGSLGEISILKSAGDEALDAEALRVVRSIRKKWKPGQLNGKPVPVKYALPLTFRL